MVSPVIACVFVGVVLYQIYKYLYDRPKNFPPGPPRLPVFGAYLYLLWINSKHLHRAVESLTKKYQSKLIGCYIGPLLGVFVHDLKTCKEVLNNPDLDGRPKLEIIKTRDPNFNILGIFFRDGLFWKNQRRFTLRHLRDFGFGRRFDELEVHYNDELQTLVDTIKFGPKYKHEEGFLKEGGLVLLPKALHALPANLFLQIITNNRYNRMELSKLFQASDYAMGFQKSGDVFGRFYSYMISARYLAPNLSGFNDVRKNSMGLHYVLRDIVMEQYKTFDEKHERHFLDLYFKQIKMESPDFSIDQLVHTTVDFMFPSITAIGITISHALLRLVQQTELIKRCQNEIDDIVGHGRLPTLDDRINLPLTEATLRESLRLDTLVPNGVPHVALRDTTVAGYDLPEGSVVFTMLQASHEDEDVYKDGLKFNPDRFISRGTLCLRLDTSLPFGAGKRLCAGETFARNTMFLMLATILQNFNFSAPAGCTVPDPALEPHTTGIIKLPPDFWLKFEAR